MSGIPHNTLLPYQFVDNTTHDIYLDKRGTFLGQRPIFFVLVFLGVVGIGVTSVGIAGFGGHQNWWNMGGLTKLNQVNTIIMMSMGGGTILAVGIIGIVSMVTTHNRSAHLAIDASYDHDDETGIIDLAYCNAELGFGCIVDGADHNNPRMKTPLKQHFDPFIKQYAAGLAEVEKTQEGLLTYFKDQIRYIEEQFKDATLPINQQKIHSPQAPDSLDAENDITTKTFLDPSYKPAMSFVQLVQLPDKIILLTAQAGDAMIVVEMPDGKLLTTQKSNNCGVGDPVEGVKIESFDITGAKRIIGFSDGIGEFVTFEELKEIINANKSEQLFAQLKARAMSQRPISAQKGANGGPFKLHRKNSEGHVDDMSLFILDL